MNRKFLSLAIIAFAYTAHAAETDSAGIVRVLHQDINFQQNMLYESSNPSRLAFNSVKSVLTASLSGCITRGDYHAVDVSGKHNDFGVNIAGMKQVGRFSVEGHIAYLNSKDYNHRFRSSLFLTPTNPFLVCDTVLSDVTCEQFDLGASVAYPFNDRLTGGLQLRYLTGNSADQTDPRPKINSMRFTATPGAIYRLNERHKVGLSADVELYRSDISHTNINPLERHIYFVMKGMGDNVTFTTSDMSSYPRNYRGLTIGGKAQWLTEGSKWSNLMEAGAGHNQENAEDGGSSYTYKGGDYSLFVITLDDRLRLTRSSAWQHDIRLHASYESDKGKWYDQKKLVDTEHGNLAYYETLSSSQVQNGQRIGATLGWLVSHKESQRPDWDAGLDAGFQHVKTNHYEVSTSVQQYNLLSLSAHGKKRWKVGKGLLQTSLEAGLKTPLGTPEYASVRNKLAAEYVAPLFEYATARNITFGGNASWHFPLKVREKTLWPSVGIDICHSRYAGNNKQTSIYDGTSLTRATLQLAVCF